MSDTTQGHIQSSIISISSENFKTKKQSNSSSNKNKNKGSGYKGKKHDKSNVKREPRPVRERTPRVFKKLYRLIVRKLPATNYGMEDFKQSVASVCNKLSLDCDDFIVEHFVSGWSLL